MRDPTSPDPSPQDAAARALVERCLAGDSAAFRALLDMHRDYTYAIAFRLLRDPDDARDVAQETWIRVWKHLHRYRPGAKFTTWLYRIAVNLCYDRMRRDARRRRLFPPETSPGLPDRAHIEHESRELRDAVLEAARRLPPRQRLVFQLRDVQDLTVAETAAVARMSTAAVKTNLCYARKTIRELLRATAALDSHE